ncbi:MAG TPA: FAD-dependent oxidoreductase, partial [Solirubrobacteraceae bacterium]|nr:FAD-dependent oxidoreductase [Solirubrobacteraceae bacterium]
MSVEHAKPDVAVVGGGPIGLASAWRAAQRGLRVCVLDAGDPGAWQVAAGMLAPVAEAQFGEDALLDLSLRAAAGFPDLCAELAEASGRDPGLHATGTLVVARDRDEAEALDRLLAFRQRLGLAVERLLPSAARRAEPALAPT